MMALILAVGLLQAAQADVTVRVTVVRPACAVVSPDGTTGWVESRRPGPDAVHCTRSSDRSLAPPRIVSAVATIEGREFAIVEINH